MNYFWWLFFAGWSYQTQDSWSLIPGNQCNGNSQSPIDIISSIAITTDLGPFVLDGYTDENSNMDLVNNGRNGKDNKIILLYSDE